MKFNYCYEQTTSAQIKGSKGTIRSMNKLQCSTFNKKDGKNMPTVKTLTKRAWFCGSILSKNTLLCNLCCSTCGFLAKTFRMSATTFCIEENFKGS